MSKPVKPILRYYGGKWNLAPWVLANMPTHRIYVEPFGGAASVLLQKDRSFSEVYNDLDGDIVNLFRVLQDQGTFEALHRKLKYTPYARDEFMLAYQPADDPIEKARRLLILSWMGYSSSSVFRQTGYRTNAKYVQRSNPAGDWKRLIEHIDLVVERLQGVNIENRPAQVVIHGHDTEETLFYIDPPYPLDTRHDRVYNHEMDDSQHRDLAQHLHRLNGMVMISGYACDLYDRELYPGWKRITRQTYADGARERTEVLWLSPRTVAALERDRSERAAQKPVRQQLELFEWAG